MGNKLQRGQFWRTNLMIFPPHHTIIISILWVYERLRILLVLLEGLQGIDISILVTPALLRPLGARESLLPRIYQIGLSISKKPTTIQYNGLKFREFINRLLYIGSYITNPRSFSFLVSKRG